MKTEEAGALASFAVVSKPREVVIAGKFKRGSKYTEIVAALSCMAADKCIEIPERDFARLFGNKDVKHVLLAIQGRARIAGLRVGYVVKNGVVYVWPRNE